MMVALLVLAAQSGWAQMLGKVSVSNSKLDDEALR